MQQAHRDYPSRQLVRSILRGIGVTSKAAFNISHFEELNWLQDVILYALMTASRNPAGLIFKAIAERWSGIPETPFEVRTDRWQMLAKEYSMAQPNPREKQA